MESEHKKPLSTMPWLPVDVMMDILCRLPVKSLLRFRCVSKQFRSTIDGPDFIKRHLQNRSLHHHQRQRLIGQGTYQKLVSVDLDSVDNAIKLEPPFENWEYVYDLKVIGSCNGLLALSHSGKNSSIGLWNIATRKHQTLPKFWSDFGRYFDGFGYDAASDDYKLVRITYFYKTNVTEVSVYSLKANCWRRIDGFPPHCRYFFNDCMAALVEGTLNWVAMVEDVEDRRKGLIVSFDLKSEKFFEVSLPDTVQRLALLGVMVLGGCLCLLYAYPFQLYFDVWVMKEYRVKESWTKLYSFSYEETCGGSPQLPSIAQALVYSKRGDEVFIFQDDGEIFLYDLEKKKAESVQINEWPTNISTVTTYVDSLVSPNVN